MFVNRPTKKGDYHTSSVISISLSHVVPSYMHGRGHPSSIHYLDFFQAEALSTTPHHIIATTLQKRGMIVGMTLEMELKSC